MGKWANESEIHGVEREGDAKETGGPEVNKLSRRVAKDLARPAKSRHSRAAPLCSASPSHFLPLSFSLPLSLS